MENTEVKYLVIISPAAKVKITIPKVMEQAVLKGEFTFTFSNNIVWYDNKFEESYLSQEGEDRELTEEEKEIVEFNDSWFTVFTTCEEENDKESFMQLNTENSVFFISQDSMKEVVDNLLSNIALYDAAKFEE